jgi:hypothetical protein
MAFNDATNQVFSDVEPRGDEASLCRSRVVADSSYAYINCAKTQLSGHVGFPPGKFSSGVNFDGSDESSDDNASTGCSEAAASWSDVADSVCSGRQRFLSTTDLMNAPDVSDSAEEAGYIFSPPPGLQLPTAFGESTPGIPSHVGPPPGLSSSASIGSCNESADESACIIGSFSVERITEFKPGALSHFTATDLVFVPDVSSFAEHADSALPPPPPGLELARDAVSYPPGMFEWDQRQSGPIAFNESECWAQSYNWFSTQAAVPQPCTKKPQAAHPKGNKCVKTQAAASAIRDEERTTIMLRNLPSDFSRDSIADVLDQEGFKARYDFVYMPMNFKTWAVFGYGFVNFVTPTDAQHAKEHFEGFSWPGVSKKIEVVWSDAQQGLEALVERFRSSPVMHDAVPDAVRPAVYQGGVRDVFPPPTKPIKMPNMRTAGD